MNSEVADDIAKKGIAHELGEEKGRKKKHLGEIGKQVSVNRAWANAKRKKK